MEIPQRELPIPLVVCSLPIQTVESVQVARWNWLAAAAENITSERLRNSGLLVRNRNSRLLRHLVRGRAPTEHTSLTEGTNGRPVASGLRRCREGSAPIHRNEIAQQIEHFLADLARRLVDAGVRRIVVGEVETNGTVVSALNVDTLQIGREIDPGVPYLIAAGEFRLASR